MEKASVRAALLNAEFTAGRFEAVYPTNRTQVESYHRTAAEHVAPPADLQTLLVRAQFDPNFRTRVGGKRDLTVWWVHGCDAHDAVADAWTHAAFQSSGALFIGSDVPFAVKDMETLAHRQLRGLSISEWDRTPIAAGTVVIIDDRKWLAGVAASCVAAHFGTRRCQCQPVAGLGGWMSRQHSATEPDRDSSRRDDRPTRR